MEPEHLGLLVLRVAVGVVMLAHGWNHIYGGGRIAGTARWFDSLGMRPGLVHAWAASLTEVAAGVLLILGLLTPVAGAAVIGVMIVALVTNHLHNGFFIFRPGEGYEYVLVLIACGALIATAGGGAISVDAALGVLDPPDWRVALAALAVGVAGGVAQLVLFWRPPPAESAAEASR